MDIQALETLLHRGVDNALLRFTLGAHYLKVNQPRTAITHLEQSLQRSPDYSAAWKLLGKAHALHGDAGAAHGAWTEGMAVAERNGDKQAHKEMAVFLRRLERAAQQDLSIPATRY
jgi:predicted Zn-dependent protease